MLRTLMATVCIALMTLAVGSASRARAADPQSPEGLWRTIDDKTGAPRALVRIRIDHGVLTGHIEHSFREGAEHRVCDVCSDDRKDKPIIGLEIIRGMSGHDGEFGGGEILDPETGSVYRCHIRLEDGGQHLVVRGYIGISLLGRSQTWLREPSGAEPSRAT